MTQPEWLMLGHVCKVGIVLTLHPFHFKWKGKMIF